jgi:hypothetical protein
MGLFPLGGSSHPFEMIARERTGQIARERKGPEL